MSTRMQRALMLVLALVPGVLLCILSYTSAQFYENIDRFYHYAISEEILRNGLPFALPAVADLGWRLGFPEKEFLFHLLTAAGMFLGGEEGVRAVCLGIATLSLALLFVHAARRLGATAALLLVLLCCLAESYFAFRLLMIRPHVLALACFLVLVLAVAYGRSLSAFVAGVLFSLAYHALYLPFAVCVLAALVAVWQGRRLPPRAAVIGILGLAIGAVANPYFPLSVRSGYEHLLMALDPPAAIPPYFVGAELLKPRWTQVLQVFYPQIILLVAAAESLWKYARRCSVESRPLEFSAAVSFLFGAIGLILLGKLNPRAFEYAVPLSLLAFSSAVAIARRGDVFSLQSSRIALPIVLLLLIALKAPNTYRAYTAEPGPLSKRIANAERVLRSVPREELAGKKIFNCHWDLGALILYYHPQAFFIDLLDPRLLYFRDLRLARLRLAIFEGRVNAPLRAMKEVFRADFVLCAAPALQDLLESSPELTRIAPPEPQLAEPKYTPGLYPALYRLDADGSE